jgi:NAD(P)-dependent dehydrogenase (short-subunit alcohol dehydrogenase family)
MAEHRSGNVQPPRGGMRLSGKVAIVTGGGSGLGQAIAVMFAKEGAKVVVSGRRTPPLEATVESITATGGSAVASTGDITDAVDVQRLMDTALSSFDQIDILVNNAGVMVSRATVTGCAEEDWRQTLETNLTGAFLCCKYALPELIKRRGNILFLSSVFGLIGGTNRAAYVASKGGLISLARGMALDYAPCGVRVNALCPAYIETDMNRELLVDLQRRGDLEAIIKRHPLGSLGEPTDVAYAAVYLASDEARWITGIALPIDGGMSVGTA